ncbi:aldehyde dehydrogenase [Rhodococcus opacus]|nr:aldehyde dehydrogenase family protein [Rhodococcus opacus]RKM64952.1 aldehyde dehydrogenase [Rhodococcus opacus]
MTSSTTHSVVTTGLVIDGATVATPETIDVYDPAAASTIIGRAAAASPEDARRAVAGAHHAFNEWSALSVTRRAELVLAALAVLGDSAAERATILVRENGKILQEAQVDLAVFEMRCRAAAELATDHRSTRTLAAPPFRTEIHHLPVGVVTIIVPFNWPLAILAASLPYALIAGNSVVVKPPPTAPLAVTETLRLMAEQLPPGVLNVITGTNAAVEPLITDPRVQHVVFTGSTGGGKSIMSLASQSLAKVTLELGGNDPAILLDDVDLSPVTIDSLITDTFMSTGQVCMAIKRIYVARSRHDELVDALGAALADTRVGHGLDSRTTMGPLHTGRQRTFVEELLAQAREAGAEVREYGEFVDPTFGNDGHFLLPSLVVNPSPDLRVVTEEQFGPTVPILAFDDVDPLIDQLNNDWAGLCSSVWTADLDRGGAIAQRLRTGTTWINQANAGACDDRAPFGGFRQSGVGREMGPDGLHDFTEAHVVTYPNT